MACPCSSMSVRSPCPQFPAGHVGRNLLMPAQTLDQPPDHQDILAHVERHIGRIEQIFQEPGLSGEEAGPSPQGMEVLHIAPDPALPYHLLVTAGMSRRPMAPAADGKKSDAPNRLELMMILPQAWPLSDGSGDERRGWPIRWLRTLACRPHIHNTRLDWGDVIPNDDPPRAFAAGTRLCGAILAPSLQVPMEFHELGSGPDRIAFYAVIPLYLEEMELQRREGMEALLTRLLEHDIRDVVDLKRRNVARKFLGLF